MENDTGPWAFCFYNVVAVDDCHTATIRQCMKETRGMYHIDIKTGIIQNWYHTRNLQRLKRTEPADVRVEAVRAGSDQQLDIVREEWQH